MITLKKTRQKQTKMHMKSQRHPNSRSSLEKKNRKEGHTLPDSQLYCKVMVIKIMWYWNKIGPGISEIAWGLECIHYTWELQLRLLALHLSLNTAGTDPWALSWHCPWAPWVLVTKQSKAGAGVIIQEIRQLHVLALCLACTNLDSNSGIPYETLSHARIDPWVHSQE